MQHPTIVWIDSKTARVFELAGDEFRRHVYHRDEPDHHVNPHTSRAGHYEALFYHDVAGHLAGTDAVLVLGPGVAKDQFVHHVQQHHAELARSIVAVEPSDHPSDAQLVAYARKYFKPHHTST
jgi:stalled ribosome rescue protein Dom34